MSNPRERGPGLDDVRAEFIALVSAGNYIECAASVVGVPRRTIYNWLKRGRRQPNVEPWGSFARDVAQALARSESRDVMSITLASKKDWKAAAWRLERKNPKKWGAAATKLEVKSTGTPLSVVQFFRIALPEKVALIDDGLDSADLEPASAERPMLAAGAAKDASSSDTPPVAEPTQPGGTQPPGGGI